VSQQYPGPQQPYNQQPYQGPYAGGPAPYQPPPPPPKKFMNGWAIFGFTLIGIFVFLVFIGFLGAVGDTISPQADNKATPVASSKAAPEKKDDTPGKSQSAKPAEKPAAKPNEYAEGDYVVGEDIPPGTYTTTGAKKGFFELCSISTEPTADGVMPKWKTANANERIIITLSKDDGIVTIQGCEPLRPRS
jgi:hypothetical protein